MIEVKLSEVKKITDAELSNAGNAIKRFRDSRIQRRDAFWKRPQRAEFSDQYFSETGQVVTLSKGLAPKSVMSINGEIASVGVHRFKKAGNWFVAEVSHSGIIGQISTGKELRKSVAAKPSPVPTPKPTFKQNVKPTPIVAKQKFSAQSTAPIQKRSVDPAVIDKLRSMGLQIGNFLKSVGV